jgi:hypothetical protein
MGQKRESLTHRTLAGMLWAAYGKVAFHVPGSSSWASWRAC